MKRFLLSLGVILACLIVLSAIIVSVGDGGGQSIALVYVEGMIVDARDTVEEIRDYGDDESIKAIILRVDSPGGAVAPSQEIYNEVRRVAEKKTVVVSMGTVAASGGYYVSAPAKLIIANPGTLTGSIGVIMEIPNIEGLMDKVGLKAEVIKSGRHKDMASTLKSLSPEDRKILQGIIDDVYGQFLEDVASSREMDVEKVRELADGRIYTGKQAMGLGLVDELGGLEDAIRRTAELAGIEGRPRIVERERDKPFWKGLASSLSGSLPEMMPHIKLNYTINP